MQPETKAPHAQEQTKIQRLNYPAVRNQRSLTQFAFMAARPEQAVHWNCLPCSPVCTVLSIVLGLLSALHGHCTATARPLNGHCTVTERPLHGQCTVTSRSLYKLHGRSTSTVRPLHDHCTATVQPLHCHCTATGHYHCPFRNITHLSSNND